MFPKSKPESWSQTFHHLPPHPLYPPFLLSLPFAWRCKELPSPQHVVNCNRAGWKVMGCWRGEDEGSWVAKQTLWQPTCQQVLSIIGKRRPRDSSEAPSLLSVFCSVLCLTSIWSRQAVVGSSLLPRFVQRKTEANQESRKEERGEKNTC